MRAANGQFVKGHQAAGGFTALHRKFRQFLFDKVMEEDIETRQTKWSILVDSVIDSAIKGGASHARLLFEHILGKPKETLSIEQEPITLDEQTSEALINHFVNKGMTEQEAAKRLIELEEANKIVQNKGY